MKYPLFGTDGIRCTVGQSPLTIHELPLLAYAIAQWIIETYGKNVHVLLANDSRLSSSFIKASLETGLLLHPLCIYDAGILPTPAVCQLVKHDNHFQAGIMITASHNPYQDNGIKLINHLGEKISNNEELIIEEYTKNVKEIKYTNLGSTYYWTHAATTYSDTVCRLFPTNFLTGISIALDCANGATSQIAPHIFTSLGATVTPIHNKPNGTNINENCGTQHIKDLTETIRAHYANIGLAFDGDGDRLVVITDGGIKKDGDDLLFLLLGYPRYSKEQAVVGTILSNQGFKEWLNHTNKTLIRTAVGEGAVREQMRQNNLILGGEQSGHIIMSDYLGSSDAIFTALRLLEVIIQTNNWKLQTFKHYPQIHLTVPVNTKKPLDQPPFSSIIQSAQHILSNGRVSVRYSGTEPVLRIIAEARDQKNAQQVAQQIAHQFKKELSHSGE